MDNSHKLVLIGLLFVAVAGLLFWLDERWCRKMRKVPSNVMPPLFVIFTRLGGLITLFVAQVVCLTAGVLLFIGGLSELFK